MQNNLAFRSETDIVQLALNGINQNYNMAKVAVCKVPDIREDIRASLAWIEKFAREADQQDVSLLCFPECFLQGYLAEFSLAKKYAISLDSLAFKTILQQLSKYRTMIVFGMIEEDQGALCNTAVVIKEGRLIGKYRKTYLLEGEQFFKPGTGYPVFEADGLVFGINICYDTQFAEAAASLARQGAQLILCPANTMMGYKKAEKFKHLHHQMRRERVKETGLWLLSADVMGERDGRIAYGPASAMSPDGTVVKEVPLMQAGMVIVDIPASVEDDFT